MAEHKDQKPKAKRLAATVYLTDPETQDAVAFGPGATDPVTGREIYAFTQNGEVVDSLPEWAEKAITNPNAWVK